MPLYQNSSVTTSKLILGNYKIETSPYASAAGAFTWTNLGAGMVNNWGHGIEKYDVQAGNAPDPIEGIARESFSIDMELIEFDPSVMAAISCGAMVSASAGTVMTAYGGGYTALTERAFQLTNTRLISSATKETIIRVFKATLDTGLQFTAKSDNDTDPINVMPVTITAKLDTTRSAGTQLFYISKTI